MTTWNEYLEKVKKDPGGAKWVETMEFHEKSLKEFDDNISKYVIWVTGLSIGELAFILSNLDNIFTQKGILFAIGASFLLISVLSGLIYHLLKVLLLYWTERRWDSRHELSYLRYSDDLVKSFSGEDKKSHEKRKEECNKKLNELQYPIIRTWMIIWSWKVNIASFFIGSFCLIILVSILIF